MRLRRAYVVHLWLDLDAPVSELPAVRGTLQPTDDQALQAFGSLEQLSNLLRQDLATWPTSVDPTRSTKEEL